MTANNHTQQDFGYATLEDVGSDSSSEVTMPRSNRSGQKSKADGPVSRELQDPQEVSQEQRDPQQQKIRRRIRRVRMRLFGACFLWCMAVSSLVLIGLGIVDKKKSMNARSDTNISASQSTPHLSEHPSVAPLQATRFPTSLPTGSPDALPTPNIFQHLPTLGPSTKVPASTNLPTSLPTRDSSNFPSMIVPLSIIPPLFGSNNNPEDYGPTDSPVSNAPSLSRSAIPSTQPSRRPSTAASISPTVSPTFTPSVSHSDLPSFRPSSVHSKTPTLIKSAEPTNRPSMGPSEAGVFYSMHWSTSDGSSNHNFPSSTPTISQSATPSQRPEETPSVAISSSFPSRFPTRTPVSMVPTLPTTTMNPTLHASSKPTLRSSSSRPSTMPSTRPTIEPFPDMYEDMYFAELSPQIQSAASTLGFTETIWDNNENPPKMYWLWHELSSEEKEAAAKLGFKEDGSWNDSVYDLYGVGWLNSLFWDDLPPSGRDAASMIGYSRSLWNNDVDPPQVYWLWSELGPMMQGAAGKLGYSMVVWNNYVYENTEESAWDDYYFDDLPIEIRQAAMVLGFNRDKWDGGEETVVTLKTWNQLSAGQRNAAMKLGYDQESW